MDLGALHASLQPGEFQAHAVKTTELRPRWLVSRVSSTVARVSSLRASQSSRGCRRHRVAHSGN